MTFLEHIGDKITVDHLVKVLTNLNQLEICQILRSGKIEIYQRDYEN